MFNFDGARLQQLADCRVGEFAAAEPLPHLVIDDFVEPELIAAINAEFDEVGKDRTVWQHFENSAEVKFALADITRMGDTTASVLAAFNAQPFVGFLEQMTGISGLVVDPGYSGGGMHEITRGGVLKMHVDFNLHNDLRLDRRLNSILYLNDDWDDAWGGHLELWDRDMTEAVVKVAPKAGRLVTFATSEISYHGHPDPLQCPPDRFRRSLALYYYSNGRPDEEVADRHTTIFKARPGEEIVTRADRIKRWVPPVLVDAARRFRR
jgi:Rps23 Pro-64 3,4-dihydroxylase Tpa1-like proline 4-hydroxylase